MKNPFKNKSFGESSKADMYLELMRASTMELIL